MHTFFLIFRPITVCMNVCMYVCMYVPEPVSPPLTPSGVSNRLSAGFGQIDTPDASGSNYNNLIRQLKNDLKKVIMYVCMYDYGYVSMYAKYVMCVCMYVCASVGTLFSRYCTFPRTCHCMYVCMYVCMYDYGYVSMYAKYVLCVCMYVCLCFCGYVIF